MRSRTAIYICAGAACLMPGAAFADQYKQAADNARIECVVSKQELTRIALIGDQFASVSKISSGTPYNDFAVTNEPVRGDIYISVPETYLTVATGPARATASSGPSAPRPARPYPQVPTA